MDEELVFTWTFIMNFILGIAIIGVAIFFMHQGPLTDISKAYSEYAAVKGGFTSTDIANIKTDLANAGYDPSKITITIQAYDINGTNISSKAYPITPMNQSPYPATPNFVPRGGKIVLKISSSENTTIDEVSKILGDTNAREIKHSIKREVMSERIR